MDVTSIGHAGMLIETEGGSILCDPWFEPAFFGSWFPFPRNDQLSDDLLDRIEHADFLYISHLHGDHHDEAWLTGTYAATSRFCSPDSRLANSNARSPRWVSPSSSGPPTLSRLKSPQG